MSKQTHTVFQVGINIIHVDTFTIDTLADS